MVKRKYAAFGEQLRRERTNRDLIQREAAAKFNVAQPSYHRWESGESLPDESKWHEVAEVLGITVQDMYELLHGTAAPVSLEGIQNDMKQLRQEHAAEVGALQRQVSDLRELAKRLEKALVALESE